MSRGFLMNASAVDISNAFNSGCIQCTHSKISCVIFSLGCHKVFRPYTTKS